MKKRFYLLMLSVITIALVSVGWVAFADQAPKSGSSDSVTGILYSLNSSSHQITVTGSNGKHQYELADSVWVYRNNKKAELTDLKKSDRLELILNSKDQVSYIKAVSGANHSESAEPKKEEQQDDTAQNEATQSQTQQTAPQTDTTTTAPAQQDDKVTEDQQNSTEVESDDEDKDDDANIKVDVKVSGVEIGAQHGKKLGWYKEHKHPHPHANVKRDDEHKDGDHKAYEKEDDDHHHHEDEGDDD